jgi:hypothetical protein
MHFIFVATLFEKNYFNNYMRNKGNAMLDSCSRKVSKERSALFLFGGLVIVLFVGSCLSGLSQLSSVVTGKTLFGQGDEANIRIIYASLLAWLLAVLLASAGLGVSCYSEITESSLEAFTRSTSRRSSTGNDD